MNHNKFFHKLSQTGQSLVETALFLPLLIIIVGGVVEVSNILVTSNRVTTATRAATGFGSANIQDSGWEGTAWAEEMATVARNTVTDTLNLESTRWDIWTIKATTNAAGDDFSEWNVQHPFGDNLVFTSAEWTAQEAQIKNDVLTELTAESRDAANLEIVATVSYHQISSMLGLNMLEGFGSLSKINAMSVMRVDNPTPYGDNGTGVGGGGVCSVFPIAINYNNFSLYWSDYTAGIPLHDPSDPITIYSEGTWAPTGIAPVYTSNDPGGFPLNQPGWQLAHAQKGYIYQARDENGGSDSPGNFGWLSWDGQTNANALGASLAYPGNLVVSYNPPAGYVRFKDPTDGPAYEDLIPSVGDWVQGAAGNMNSMTGILETHINTERIVQIPVYDQTTGSGSHYDYHIAGFALVRIVGYRTTGNDKRILIEFHGWANELCEQSS
jgi:Flp pilus assembly protein TadG